MIATENTSYNVHESASELSIIRGHRLRFCLATDVDRISGFNDLSSIGSSSDLAYLRINLFSRGTALPLYKR